MYSYYEIIRCVKRIALPSPKQHALLNPIFFFLPFFLFFSSLLSSFLPIRFFFCSTTGDTSKRRGFRHNGILLARWSSAHVSFASFRACLNRGNRLSLYLSFLLALSLFFYSTPLPPLRFRLSYVVAVTVQRPRDAVSDGRKEHAYSIMPNLSLVRWLKIKSETRIIIIRRRSLQNE